MNTYNCLMNNLEELNLHRFKEHIDTYLDMIASGSKTALDALYELTEKEMNFRTEQAITGCVKVANFPYIKEIKEFSERSNDANTTILFCLDEFASLGTLEITDALRKLRKKHVRIMMLTQSMADIDLIYGHDERMAMLNNYRYKVILGADDTDTQEYFAKLIGYKKTKKYSQSSNSKTTTHTESDAKEWAIEPAELARLKNKLVLLHPDGYMKLKKNFYFK